MVAVAVAVAGSNPLGACVCVCQVIIPVYRSALVLTIFRALTNRAEDFSHCIYIYVHFIVVAMDHVLFNMSGAAVDFCFAVLCRCHHLHFRLELSFYMAATVAYCLVIE